MASNQSSIHATYPNGQIDSFEASFFCKPHSDCSTVNHARKRCRCHRHRCTMYWQALNLYNFLFGLPFTPPTPTHRDQRNVKAGVFGPTRAVATLIKAKMGSWQFALRFWFLAISHSSPTPLSWVYEPIKRTFINMCTH